jgi:hypothetical protein
MNWNPNKKGKTMRKILLYDRFSLKGKPQERKLECEGWFHCFMQEGTGGDIVPVAVVELGDGTVETWPADHVKFVKVEDKGTPLPEDNIEG